MERTAPNHKDFRILYTAAHLVRQHGWQNLYNFSLQRTLMAGLGVDWFRASNGVQYHAFEPFVSPPWAALLALPFSYLPYMPASFLFSLLVAVCLVVATGLLAPGRAWERVALILLPFSLIFVDIAVYEGQLTLIVGGSVALAAWLVRRNQYGWAGLAFVPTLLKPQLVMLLPLLFLVSGDGRLLLSWAAGGMALSAFAVLSVGTSALVTWVRFAVVFARPYRALLLIGHVPMSYWYAAWLPIAALVALAGWRCRGRQWEMKWAGIGVALAASLFMSSYLTLTDLWLYIVAFWLAMRALPSLPVQAALLLIYLSFASVTLFLSGGPGALSVVGSEALLLGILAYQMKRRERPAAGDPSLLDFRRAGSRH